MESLVIINLFIVLCTAVNDQMLWTQFKENYSKSYRNIKEDRYRYSIFQNNIRLIESHNQKYRDGKESYFMGINKFTDLTNSEFQSTLTYSHNKVGGSCFNAHNTNKSSPTHTFPTSIDWSDKGVVTAVKDQGKCNGCWAFSATGALEGQYAIKYGTKISFSEQELIDCSKDYGTIGCLGGRMEYAFNYVQYHKLSTEEDYPYLGENNECRNSTTTRTDIFLNGYTKLNESELDLAKAVALVGPISVGINADQLQLYEGGIFNPSFCSHEMDHGVLIVGYGTERGLDFWRIKNSWGNRWGEDGYFRIARNKDNLCGITCDAVYPNLS